jgi:hypothetical protein
MSAPSLLRQLMIKSLDPAKIADRVQRASRWGQVWKIQFRYSAHQGYTKSV